MTVFSKLQLLSVPVLLLILCTPPVTIKPVIEPVPNRPVRIIRGDTIAYQIAFTDDRERDRFNGSFIQFLKEQNFPAERCDSAGVYTVVKILPIKNTALPAQGPETPVAAQPARNEAATAAPDTALPPAGGSLRLYYPRGTIDYPYAALVNAYPFCERRDGDSVNGYFTIANSSATAITLKLARKITSSAGRTLGVLDLIELWTRYIREHPAEGLALFRSCDGITEYLSGQEAIVRGFSALDNSTLRIKLSTPDPAALDRLRSPRTLPAVFKFGSYAPKMSRENDLVLSANPAAAGDRPFVNEVTVRCGGDGNPLLSFSLNRYDAVTLWSAPDIEYGRTNLLKNGTCSMVGRDCYFIACTLQDSCARAFIRSLLSGQELLRNFVKAEGVPIQALENDSTVPLAAAQPQAAAVPKPAVQEPLTILFRKDDAVSKIVAEKLLAAVTHAGIAGTLMASNEKSYETALASRSYGCAVAWVPETVRSDRSEKLRLAAVFFSNEPDEQRRLQGNWEIPLFSIDWYLLAKSRVGLYKGKLSGIYVKQETK